MTEPRDDYIGEGGDGTDPALPVEVPAQEPDPEPEEDDDAAAGPE